MPSFLSRMHYSRRSRNSSSQPQSENGLSTTSAGIKTRQKGESNKRQKQARFLGALFQQQQPQKDPADSGNHASYTSFSFGSEDDTEEENLRPTLAEDDLGRSDSKTEQHTIECSVKDKKKNKRRDGGARPPLKRQDGTTNLFLASSDGKKLRIELQRQQQTGLEQQVRPKRDPKDADNNDETMSVLLRARFPRAARGIRSEINYLDGQRMIQKRWRRGRHKHASMVMMQQPQQQGIEQRKRKKNVHT